MYLAQPAWLLLLILLPLLVAGAVLVARSRRRQWHAFVAVRLRPVLLRAGTSVGRWFALAFLLAATALLIVALARPQGDAGVRSEKTTGRNILIALDLSRSMRVSDVKPDRLAQAKVVIYELLEALPNERIGLLGFAGTAHLLAPLTIDHGAIRETVEQTDENWVEFGGTNFTTLLRLAIKTLKATGQQTNALIILSDGDKHDENLTTIADEAKRAGIYIFAIGVGTDDGGFVPSKDFPNGRLVGPDGREVLSRLQAATLRRLASETGGRFATADGSTDIPAMVKLAANDLDTFEMEGRERRNVIEFYQWLVLPAVLFLIISTVAATRWRGVSATAALTASLLTLAGTPPARAGEVAEAEALLAKGRHDEARAAFSRLAETARFPDRAARFSLGEGTAAYRAGNFPTARAAFSRALLADDPQVAGGAHFGLGNCLFQIGWQTLAGSTYPTEAKEVPDLPAFDAIVKQRLAAILKAKPGGDEPTAGVAELERLALDWADAIAHYDSALQTNPANADLRHNRDTASTFFNRLLELLAQEHQQTQDSIPEPQPTPAPGNPGEEQSDGPGQQQDKPEGEPKDPGDNPPNQPGQPDPKDPPDGKGQDDPTSDPPKDDKGADKPAAEKPQEPPAEKPGETPEEAARRILSENADLQKGPPRAAQHIQRVPKKDW
jgi:Ca-activated chloride channel family protein